jgi:hypothetical protein
MSRRAASPGYTCPSDGCRLRPFAVVPVGLGFTVRLLGCRYCNFDLVGAAEDANGRVRPVARWGYNPDAGLYRLVAEYGPNSPGWLDASAAALPVRKPE